MGAWETMAVESRSNLWAIRHNRAASRRQRRSLFNRKLPVAVARVNEDGPCLRARRHAGPHLANANIWLANDKIGLTAFDGSVQIARIKSYRKN